MIYEPARVVKGNDHPKSSSIFDAYHSSFVLMPSSKYNLGKIKNAVAPICSCSKRFVHCISLSDVHKAPSLGKMMEKLVPPPPSVSGEFLCF
jgi:hypothetical protein